MLRIKNILDFRLEPNIDKQTEHKLNIIDPNKTNLLVGKNRQFTRFVDYFKHKQLGYFSKIAMNYAKSIRS